MISPQSAVIRLVALVLVISFAWTPVPAAAAECEFILGFNTIKSLIGAREGPDKVGDCLENQRFNSQNGDAVQQTTGGLLVWRKADNWTAFTDGYRTWINGPYGLAVRLNTEQFSWEGGPHSPSTPPTPTPVPVPSPSQTPTPQASTGVSGLPYNYSPWAPASAARHTLREAGVRMEWNTPLQRRLIQKLTQHGYEYPAHSARQNVIPTSAGLRSLLQRAMSQEGGPYSSDERAATRHFMHELMRDAYRVVVRSGGQPYRMTVGELQLALTRDDVFVRWYGASGVVVAAHLLPDPDAQANTYFAVTPAPHPTLFASYEANLREQAGDFLDLAAPASAEYPTLYNILYRLAGWPDRRPS